MKRKRLGEVPRERGRSFAPHLAKAIEEQQGREGIYELLVLDEAMRRAVRSAGRSEEIRNLARLSGFRPMQQYALESVNSGVTTLEEVLRVVPFEHTSPLACTGCGSQPAPTFRFCPHCAVEQCPGISA